MYKSLNGLSTKKNDKFYSYSDSSNVALSQKTSRFWIPFDVKILETLSPIEYLEKYCRINHRRWIVYKRIFDKYKDNEAQLTVLPDALSDAYMGTFDNRLIGQMIVLLDFPSNSKITFTQFSGIAAFSERYLFKIFRQVNYLSFTKN
ncbi:unnamed protein product [Rotaria magnacalcarata]|uniref:Uncharacterized protein n=1 Tax=Rotaria magnacalcarata TaxID=392030 RepID=A0A816SUB0_9BILA|nr:unnamed protein product [Rotaria magnacalcarata]